MKIILIVGFLLSYVLFLPPSLVKYFTFFSLHAVVFRKKCLHFKASGDCFSLLDSTCSRAAPETPLGLGSIANNVKNLILMRNWKRLFVNCHENNRPILAKS